MRACAYVMRDAGNGSLAQFDPVSALTTGSWLIEGRLNRRFRFISKGKVHEMPEFTGLNPHALVVRDGTIRDEAFFPKRPLSIDVLCLKPGTSLVADVDKALLLSVTRVYKVFKCQVLGTRCTVPNDMCTV